MHRIWGHRFEWTDQHCTPEQYEPLKYSYDVLGEECLQRLNAISPPQPGTLPRNNPDRSSSASIPGTTEEKKELVPAPKRDLYALLEQHHSTDAKLDELWQQIHTVPDWVDWAQIERGQDVFYRYGGPALTGLTFQSLLGGMGAARVVETLARTGGFSPNVARGRLFETTQHVLQCTRSLAGIQPGGEGHASSVRVRLLHAAVRQRIMTLASQRPSYYNTAAWGIPINDLDTIATIATFSATLIWLSLPRQGIFLAPQEITDYLALWRYIAHLMGTPTTPFASSPSAKAFMESLLTHEVRPSPTSQTMAANVITALQNKPPFFVSAHMLTASARWLNGPHLADALALPRVPRYYTCLMAGQCLFFVAYCYTYRYVLPAAYDRRRIRRAKALFWKLIVQADWGLAGQVSAFEFKHVPQFETMTLMAQAGGGGASVGNLEKVGVGSWIERRNLGVLGVGILVVGVMGVWVGRAVLGWLVWVRG